MSSTGRNGGYYGELLNSILAVPDSSLLVPVRFIRDCSSTECPLARVTTSRRGATAIARPPAAQVLGHQTRLSPLGPSRPSSPVRSAARPRHRGRQRVFPK